MEIEIFELERTQSLWENLVDYNLTETGIHPFTLAELLKTNEREELSAIRLGYGQTNGSAELRDAISALYPDTNRDQVLVTNGSIEANFVSIWTLLEPGDELVLMLPNYMQIWGLARSFGITVKPFYLKEELKWQPNLDDLQALVSPRTKMIAICNPNNPTGAVLENETMSRIVDLARGVNAWVYADEIYHGAELDGKPTPTFYGLYEKTLVAGGLSKAYALPGLRIGWLVGPPETIAQCWARRDYISIATGILSNRIAALALQPRVRARILKRNRKILTANLVALTDWAAEQNGLFSFFPPRAGGMAFLRYHFDINSTELATRLREEKGIFIVAGDCFGMDHFVRIGIGSELDYLLTGLGRFSEFLAEM